MFKCRDDVKDGKYELEWIPRGQMTADLATHPCTAADLGTKTQELGLVYAEIQYFKKPREENEPSKANQEKDKEGVASSPT